MVHVPVSAYRAPPRCELFNGESRPCLAHHAAGAGDPAAQCAGVARDPGCWGHANGAERANAKERRFAARTTKQVPKRCQRPRGARRCEPHAVVRRRGCETCRALRARSISGHQRAARSACGQMKVNERQITCRTLRVRSISGQPTCRALRVRSACVSSLRLTYDRSTCVSSPRLTCAREECVSSQYSEANGSTAAIGNLRCHAD